MSYSGEVRKFGNWLKKETKITEVTYNKLPSSGMRGISARIIYLGDTDLEIKKDFRIINLMLRLSGDAESWDDILDTIQYVQNNLVRERQHNITFGDVENPDGATGEGGDFSLDMPLKIRVSTGKESL